MTTTETVEKLLLQIFETKNRIKQQVKQQTDFYTQHLASKLLVDGITPPSWLWNDNQSSDAPKELSKEDLISEILLPHPPPTIRFPSACSLYNKPVAAGDFGELVYGVSNETYSCSKCFNGGDKQAIAASCRENNTVSTTNVVPELDVSIISPLLETQVRISNTYSAPDQSVARIQRSKSRQKALQLRNSAKADHLHQKNEAVGSPARSRLSVFRSEQDQVLDFQEFGQPCITSRESCGGAEINVERKSFCTGIVTRSRSSVKQPCSMEEFQKHDSITDNLQDTSYSLRKNVHDFRQWPDLVNVSLELINPDVTAECGGLTEAREEACLEAKGNGTDTCVGRISGVSFSSHRPCSPNEAPELNVSIHSAVVDRGVIAQSNDRSVQQLNDANDFLDVTKHSVELVHKRTRSQTSSGNGGMSMLLDTSNAAHERETSSTCGTMENSQTAKYEAQNSSQIILPFTDTYNVLNQQGDFESVIGDGPVKNQPENPRSTSDDAGLECLLAKSSWDYSVLMEPKQLCFDDTKECYLNDNSRSTEESYNLEKSPDKVFDTSFHPASSLIDQVSYGDTISENALIVEPGVSTKEDEVHGSSLHTDNHDDIKKKKDGLYDYSTQNTVAVDSEATLLRGSYVEFTCPANIVEPNVVESPNSESHVILYCKEVSEPELRHNQGNYAYKRNDASKRVSHHSQSKQSRSSNCSRAAKEATGVLEECLIKEVETVGPANLTSDATGQHCANENQNSSCLGSKPCSESITNVSGGQKTLSSSLGGEDLFTCGSFESRLANHENLDVLRSGELQIAKKSVVERNLRYVKVDSWPRSKRRKIQDQETDCNSASPSFRGKKQYASQMDSRSLRLKKVGDDVETVPGYASPVNESAEIELYQKMAHQLTEGMESFSKLHTKESAMNFKELAEHGETNSSSKLAKLGGASVSNLIKDPARVSQGYSTEDISWESMSIDARKDSDEKDNQHYLEVADNLESSEGLMKQRSLLEENYYLEVDGQLSCGLVQPLAKKDLDLTGAEETMPPDLEGFIIDPQTVNKEVNIPGHLINFDKLKSPRTSTEHSSILEQIRKSTVIQTPLTQLSSTFSLPGSQKFCHSVPNGLLECMGLRDVSPINEVADDKLRVRDGCNGNDHLKKLSYSDFPRSPRAHFGLDSRISYASPVGKLWERIFLHTGSSEKRLNSNPELVCFTIEEDPSISEENERASELTDKIHEESCSLVDACAKREPLADITEANAVTSVSAGDKFVNRASKEDVNAKISLKGPDIKVKQKQQIYNKNESEEEENSVLPVVANGTMKVKGSTSSRFSKANSSRKTSSKMERQKLSEKKPKRNNIVSNVTSFVPLVQQKQAAAVCAGKRDVKVKALEAAEAAKRLEEKRQNERQMRKEALKLERARVEQENLRQMELNKKKKVEERKKRDADIVAKKRLREEEEKKEKERKRKRTEEARRLQREGGTLCSQKAEKEKQFLNIDKGDCGTKESDNPVKRSQNLVKESREEISFQKPETDQRPDECPAHFQEAGVSVEACGSGTAGDSCIDEKAMPALAKSGEMDDLVVQKSPEKSYDISPYQCSDDEEDEEEENIPRKFIPSWASKNCVALVLPLQQGIEPEAIFPPESFCSVDKLVLQRK